MRALNEQESPFRSVPRTGVIFVNAEAQAHGYVPGDPEWANLGQGMPETGALEGGPERISRIDIDDDDQEYAPIAGVPELREAVAEFYNRTFRKGLKQYRAENVAIAPGGRAALTRTVAALGTINLGHFLPDYTAYEELLEIFRMFSSIPIPLEPNQQYAFDSRDLHREIRGRGLSAVLLSNPCNPTGRLVYGAELRRWLSVARETNTTLIFDEFYADYIWEQHASKRVSAAAYVVDPDRDPTIILDGLTKNWRYPGWRISWIVGPRQVIEAATSAGSFLDGGSARPMQRAAIALLEPERAEAEGAAIRRSFGEKRKLMLKGLRAAGVEFDIEPEGTFYCWGRVDRLPAPLNTADGFFKEALRRKVICVPGHFFDVNPGKRRHASRFETLIRFSFGPRRSSLELGIQRIREMVEEARRA